jgi:hypothetical protein
MPHLFRPRILCLAGCLLCSASLEAFFNLDFEGIRGQFKEDWTENPDRQDWVAWEEAAPGWSHSPGNDTQGVYFNSNHFGTTQQFILENNYNPYEREYLENYGELPPGTPTFWEGNLRLLMISGHLSPHEDEPGFGVVQNAWISQQGLIEADMKSIHMKAEVWGVLGVWIEGVEIQMTEKTTNVWVGDISAYAGQTVELKIGDNTPYDEDINYRGGDLALDAIRFSTEAAVPEPAAFALCAGAIALLGLIARRRRRLP